MSRCYKDDINDAAADFLAMIADKLRDPLPVSADSNLHPSPHQGGCGAALSHPEDST